MSNPPGRKRTMITYGAALLSFATTAASIALRQHRKLQYQHRDPGGCNGKQTLPESREDFGMSTHVINSIG